LHSATKNILALERADHQDILFLSHEIIIMNSIARHTSEVESWGRGVEALLFGQLTPTIINPIRLRQAYLKLEIQAKEKGLRALNQDNSEIFKSDISFIATEDQKITVFIHIPFVRMEPMELLEHLPIPFELEGLLFSIESEKKILATNGKLGLQMSRTDLLHCQMEKKHSGNIYICPNTNLLCSNIENTCLGALHQGNTELVHKQCDHYVKKMEESDDFATQISKKKFVMFSKRKQVIQHVCPDGTRTTEIIGLKIIETPDNCQVQTESYHFWPELQIHQAGDFFDQTMNFSMTLMSDYTPAELTKAYEELNQIHKPERRHIAELRNWIKQAKATNMFAATTFGTSSIAIMLCLTIVTIFVCCFCAYRRSVSQSNH